MFFALTCSERTASLAKLDLRYSRVIPEEVVFSLTSPRKRGNPSQLAKAFLARFSHIINYALSRPFFITLRRQEDALSSPYSTLLQTKPSVHLICKALQSRFLCYYWTLAPPTLQGPLCSFSFNYCGSQWQCFSG